MRRPPGRRGAGRGHRERELVQRQIAGSPETPTDPAAPMFSVESPDSTSAGAGAARVQRVSGPARRRQRRTGWWRSSTFWQAFSGVIVAAGFLVGGVLAFASLQRDIAVHTEGLKGLNEKHNTFADRVRDDFNRMREDIKELFGARRRESEAPR
jgi:hypothetical protein